jgi:putative transposase
MPRDTTVIAFRQPEAIDDPMTEVAREGARRMLAQVLIAEAASFIAMWKDLRLPDGRDRIVRQGHGPHRAIQTGVGPVEVRRAKVRDRGDVGAEEKIRFTSSILPKWARRTKSLDALLPVLYLRGVSTGDFQEVLTALLGKNAPNLSPAVITRLTRSGRRIMTLGRSATSQCGDTCTCGPTGSICRPGWKRLPNACWC